MTRSISQNMPNLKTYHNWHIFCQIAPTRNL